MNTIDQMQCCHPYLYIYPYICPLCKVDGETGNHMIIHCDFSHNIWKHFIERINLSWMMSRSISDLFLQWWIPRSNPKGNFVWSVALHAICWGIWKEKNHEYLRIWKRMLSRLYTLISMDIAYWLKGFKGFPWLLFWRYPKGVVVLFFYVVSFCSRFCWLLVFVLFLVSPFPPL